MSRSMRVGLWLLAASAVFALDVPRLESRVTDLAGLLTPEQSSALEAKLRELETTDSTQLAILIIPSLEGEALEDFSERVATQWRLGQRGRDNGALLLIAMKERKVRIEVGYGLEEKLTDARSRAIIQNEIVPAFRDHRYFEGIDAASTAVIQTVRGTYRGSARPDRSRTSNSARRPFDWLILMLIPGLWVLSALGALGGGLLGAGAGAYLMYSVAGASPGLLAVGGIVGGLLGLVLGTVIRAAGRAAGSTRRIGGGPGFYGGGGGFFSGGGGGGSFGGFSGGGGSFGGGGSSGSW